MSDIKKRVNQVLQGLQRFDPRLHTILDMLAEEVQGVQDQINPIQLRLGVMETPGPAPSAPLIFTITPVSSISVLRFEWDSAENARTYEIRLGTVWDTAAFVGRTSNLRFDADPVPTGTYHYLLKSINSDNIYSLDMVEADVTIAPIGLIIVTGSVIDNNVLLYWNTPNSTWRIDYYELYKDIEFLGIKFGTFTTHFEQISGRYTYKIRARDISGNYSAFGEVTLAVDQPPDFELSAILNWFVAPEWIGTVYSNAKLYTYGVYYEDTYGTGLIPYSINRVIMPVFATETYEDHFINNSWSTPQDQITAGYPYYIEPVPSSGYIEMEWDLGAILSRLILNVTWTSIIVTGNVALSSEISYSDDDITYTTPVTATQIYAPTLRYLRVRLTATSIDDVSFADIVDFNVILNVHRETDGGVVAALSTDATGTVVTFNKLFRDIDSITATAEETISATVVVDFTDTPDPTTFKVLVFDAAGVRISCDVRWAARGII